MISFISVFVKWRKENKTSVNFQSTNSWSWMIGMCSYIHERERAHALRTDKQLKWIVQQAINKHQMNISTAFRCFIVPFFIDLFHIRLCRWWSTKDVRCYYCRFAQFSHKLWLKAFTVETALNCQTLRKQQYAQISPFHLKSVTLTHKSCVMSVCVCLTRQVMCHT